MSATTVPSADLGALLTLRDVAERLGVSLSTVKSAVRVGDLEIVRIARLVRVRPEALALYVDARIVPASSARARRHKFDA